MRRRNQGVVGAVGIVVLAATLLIGLSAGRISSLISTRGIQVEFANAAGVKTGDAVRIAGVKVGTVDSITLKGDRVVMGLRVDKDVRLGAATTAAISIETVLGTEYVALESQGSGSLADGMIPLEHTTTPFDLQRALGGLTERVNRINTPSLAASFKALSSTLDTASPEIREALGGLSTLSSALVSSDVELRQLLAHAKGVTSVIAGRSARLIELVRSADVFLQMLDARRAVISSLVSRSEQLGTELTALARQTRGTLAPALKNLSKTVAVLRANKGDLEESVQLYAPLLRYYTTVLGQGRWFDAALFGLTPKVLPSNPGTGAR